MLDATEVTRLGQNAYTKSVWKFLSGSEHSAPFTLLARGMSNEPSVTKQVSLNKVSVNLTGTEEQLFVVRDLTSLVSLQKSFGTKQRINGLTEKIMRQIQESQAVSQTNLEKLEKHI